MYLTIDSFPNWLFDVYPVEIFKGCKSSNILIPHHKGKLNSNTSNLQLEFRSVEIPNISASESNRNQQLNIRAIFALTK